MKIVTRKKTCALTGNLPIHFHFGADENHEDCIYIKTQLRIQLEDFIANGITNFYSGLERGGELWAGEQVLLLQKKYPDIKLYAVLATEEQANFWSEVDRERYFDHVLPSCKDIYIISSVDNNRCMRVRNEYLVKKADIILAIDPQTELSDTAEMIRLANKQKKEVISITLP